MATAVNGDCCVELMKGTLVLPVPRYPSSVVTDDSLKIAANQITTTLVGRVGSGDVIFRVSDTSRLVVNMLLTVDNEIVSVSAVDYTANTITVVRGFDGTPPCSHNSGRTLQANIDAWHHNSLAAEVKAIETALGPNLSNITGSGAIISRTYAWQVAPGGSLTVGNNSITLSPVPYGVSGTNANHYVYVSGGTGAAEACLITGGTAVSGAASGTLIINCANAHSGAWTVGTATAGIQEAVHVAGNSGNPVRVSAGDSTIYAGITIPYGNLAILGYGMGLTRVLGSGITAEIDAFHFASGDGTAREYNMIADLSIWGEVSQPGGWAVFVGTQNYFKAQRLYIYRWPSGVFFSDAHISQLSDIYAFDIKDASGIGVMIQGSSSYVTRLDRIIVQGNNTPGGTSKPLAGIRIRRVADVTITESHLMTCTYGLLVDTAPGWVAASIKCIGCYFDNPWSDGVRIQPAAASSVVRADFVSCWFSDSKGGFGMQITNTSGGEINSVMINECQFYSNWGAGLMADGSGTGQLLSNVRVNGSVFAGNSKGQDNVQSGATFNCSDWMFTNNRSGQCDGTGNSQASGLLIFSACDHYVVTGNDLHGNIGAGLADGGTGTHKVVANNLTT